MQGKWREEVLDLSQDKCEAMLVEQEMKASL